MSVSLYGSGQTVLQVVSGTTTTQTTTTSSTFVATAITASITPQSTTSKILVLVSGNAYNASAAVNNFTLYRNGSVAPSADLMNTYGASAVETPIAMNYLDSPATTSSLTYTVYFKTGAGTLYVPNNSILASMTLIEISGS